MSEFDSLKTLLASSTVGKVFVGVGLGRSWTVEQLLNELISKIEERDAALAAERAVFAEIEKYGDEYFAELEALDWKALWGLARRLIADREKEKKG